MRLTRLKISNYSKIAGRHLFRIYRIVLYSLQIYSTNVEVIYMGLHTDINISEIRDVYISIYVPGEMVHVHIHYIQS